MIAGNLVEDASGQPTGGAVIRMKEDAHFNVTEGFFSAPPSGKPGILIAHNRGGRLFDAEGGEDRVHLFLRNSLIADNVLDQELIRALDEPQVAIDDSTIVGNVIGTAHVLAVSDELYLRRSILWQPGKTSLSCSGCTRVIETSIASEVASLGGGPGAIVAVPRFVDPARGDYRLRAASPAIDFTAPIVGDDRDAHGLPRDQRIEGVPRAPGQVRDLGAFERPEMQPLVLNADFAGDLNMWTTPGGHGGAYDADNAPGSPAGTGSLRVSGNLAAPFLLGSFHCLHLPGPGHYRLNAWAHSQGITPTLRNAPSLLWEFRPDGGEGCIDGPITVGGEHFLNGLGGWSSPTDPTVIVIPAEVWNHNSSLTILTKVYANIVNTDFNAWFDRVTLELSVSGLPFADGFEDHSRDCERFSGSPGQLFEPGPSVRN
jgi:hypothetical protein